MCESPFVDVKKQNNVINKKLDAYMLDNDGIITMFNPFSHEYTCITE